MDGDVFLSGFFIEGEMSNLKEHSSGHIYFTLKDSGAAINCVMFRGAAVGLNFRPQNGDKIIAFGRVSSYEKTGAYQFYAEMMNALGVGDLFARFTELKDKLEKEGLFDAARKKPLPKFPRCVGVVTSADGAALKDIINVAKRRNPGVKLLLSPAAVQGDGAAADIARAVGLLNLHGKCDIIILGRGGGSLEDLWAFNEEAVARAVFASKIPVVSAVGHETDFVICDFAADLRAPTPSAAAEICIPEAKETTENVIRLYERMSVAIGRVVASRETMMESLSRRIAGEMKYRVSKAEARVASAVAALDSACPLNTLKRGYALVYAGGKLIRSSKEMPPGGEITIRLSDGAIRTEITRIETDYAKDQE